MLASLRTKFVLPTFYVFSVISKKRKKSRFFEIWKKERKIRILEHCRWHWH